MEKTAAKRMKLLNCKSNEASATTAADDHNVEAADRISDLPYEIGHHIFSFLPIKYIAQTCVLSRRWNHMWYTYPCLDFTDSSTFLRVNHISGYVEHVVSVLEKHSDVKILRFRGPGRSGLERLMKEAVTHNVEELDLNFTGYVTKEFRFNLPGCITNSLSLRILRFSSWFDNIRLPPVDAMKNGFKSLASLSLSRVYLGDQPSVLNLFTDSCSFPSLTELDLHCLELKCLRIQMSGWLRDISVRGCSMMEVLDISAEKLKKLSVVGSFPSRCPANTRVKIDAPMLASITWSPYDVTDECIIGKFDLLNEAVVGSSLFQVDYSDSKICSASNFLGGISQCELLTVDENIIKIISGFSHLAAATAGVQLCVFERLKTLKVTGLGRHNASGLASLFRSSPACSSIEISVKQWQEDLQELPHFVEDIYDWGSTGSFLPHLKYVKMLGLSKTGIGLVKFLLKHGESLQRLSISDLLTTIDSDVKDMIKSRIMGFPRASSSVHIIFQ